MFKDSPVKHHLVLDHRLFINAMNPLDSEIETLKDAVVSIMQEQPSWGEMIPKAWIYIELMITKKREFGVKVMLLEELQMINKQNPINPLGNKELDTFLKVHHSQGDIIYFPLPGLRDHIIITPNYLIDALKSIVTDKRFCQGQRLHALTSMNQDGVLKKEDISKILKNKKEFQRDRDHLILLMCHLDILAEPRSYYRGKLQQSKFYLVPSLVCRAADLSRFLDQKNVDKRSLGLSFSFHSLILPAAIGFRFIASCIDLWGVKVFDDQKMLFSGVVVVNINKSLMLIVQVKQQRLDVHLLHTSSRVHIIPDTASSIRECLNDTLYRITDSYKVSSACQDADIEETPFHTEFTCFNIESPCYNQEKNSDWQCEHGHVIPKETLGLWFVNRVSNLNRYFT